MSDLEDRIEEFRVIIDCTIYAPATAQIVGNKALNALEEVLKLVDEVESKDGIRDDFKVAVLLAGEVRMRIEEALL